MEHDKAATSLTPVELLHWFIADDIYCDDWVDISFVILDSWDVMDVPDRGVSADQPAIP